MLPRPHSVPNDRLFHLGEGPLLAPAKKGAWIRVHEAPSPTDAKALRTYAKKYGAQLIVEIGTRVPLSVLTLVEGAASVMLAGGRTSFDGLEALPTSVRRLSIEKQTKVVPLGALSKNLGLEELALSTPSVSDGPALPALRTLAWVGAKDAALDFIGRQRALVDLGLHSTAVTQLPDAPSVKRLLLFYPSKLVSLVGVERMRKLAYLRIDQPRGMKRLGDLSKLRALRAIMLLRAHAITDLSDLGTVPARYVLNVLLTKLDASAFLKLDGKLSGGRFQLKSPKESRAVREHLAIPEAILDPQEDALFDH